MILCLVTFIQLKLINDKKPSWLSTADPWGRMPYTDSQKRVNVTITGGGGGDMGGTAMLDMLTLGLCLLGMVKSALWSERVLVPSTSMILDSSKCNIYV